eukprot:jgi/Bigna1/83163/fgenesh1_pg.103_\
MMSSMPQRPSRLVEYFATCGISEDSTPIPKDDRLPIVSVAIITEKEELQPGWELLQYTVSGNIASVTGSGVFSTKTYICFERGNRSPPVTDLQIMVGNDPKPMGYTKLAHNLNKGGIGKDVFLCYTHAYHMGHTRESVVDIVMIAPKTGEKCPSDYMLVNKNLNAGSFRNPLYICVKKTSDSALEMRYKPVVLDRFPIFMISGWDSAFPQMLPVFCYPQGADVVVGENPPLPKCTTFVLTMVSGMRLYGVCINFHELLRKDKLKSIKKEATIKNKDNWRRLTFKVQSSSVEQNLQVWLPKTVCLVSYWPFYDTFATFLVELWRLTLGSSRLPPERYLSNLWETPLPQNSRVNVKLSIASSNVIFNRPPPDTFPMSDHSFELRNCTSRRWYLVKSKAAAALR